MTAALTPRADAQRRVLLEINRNAWKHTNMPRKKMPADPEAFFPFGQEAIAFACITGLNPDTEGA